MKRLLSYLKPHIWTMVTATLLVLLIIVVELYRPIIIGNAIDEHINGYYAPYVETTADAKGAVAYKEKYVTHDFSEEDAAIQETGYYQIVLYDNRYYMVENISLEETVCLASAEGDMIEQYVQAGAVLLDRNDLIALRHYDFVGILYAAALYLLMLFLGFVFNALDTWLLQKMGQRII